MTDDDISRGDRQRNIVTREPYDAVAGPGRVESVIARIASGPAGEPELWKLTRYFAELDDDSGGEWELHNLTRDPEEREDLASDPADPADRPRELDAMRAVLGLTRDRKRLTPRLTARD
jgi:hypothetical protein